MIDDYLARLSRGMPADRAGRAAVLDEVRDHLLEAAAGLEARGVPRDRALNRAIARFGAPEQIGAQFAPRGGWGAPPRRVLVVGVGGVGTLVAADVGAAGRPGVDVLAVDMDAAALDGVAVARRLIVGVGPGRTFHRFLHSVRYGMAERDADAVRAEVNDAEAVVVVAALGDRAGAGAAPLVARVAAATGAVTVAAVVRPAGDEASDVRRAGRLGESGLLTYADAVVLLDEHRLLFPLVSARPLLGTPPVELGERAVAVAVPPAGVAVEPAPMARVRAMAAAVLRHAVHALLDLLGAEAGFGDAGVPRALLAGAGVMSFGIGRAEGEGAAAEATRAAFASPSMELQRDAVGRVLCCLSGGGAAEEAARTIAGIVGAEARIAVAAAGDAGSAGRTRSVVLVDQRPPSTVVG